MKILIVIILTLVSTAALTCTTFFLNQSHDRIVAKNMDWPSGQGMALINKRHVKKRAIFVTPSNALEWVSKFSSLTFTQSGREFPWEGMNEAGLSVSVMYLGQTVIPSDLDRHRAVNGLQWIQFILDTASSVPEAMHNARMVKIEGRMATLEHYLVCDLRGACATFEYLRGELVIHEGAQLSYKTLTNNAYDASVDYLKKQLAAATAEQILSGHAFGSLDRFARGALWSNAYNGNGNEVQYAFAALDNVAEPAGTPWPTQWSFVFGLETRVAHFRTLQSSGVKQINLKSFNPSCKTPVMMFNMNAATAGDVSALFVPYQGEANRRLVDMSKDIQATAKPLIENYVDSYTRCAE